MQASAVEKEFEKEVKQIQEQWKKERNLPADHKWTPGQEAGIAAEARRNVNAKKAGIEEAVATENAAQAQAIMSKA